MTDLQAHPLACIFPMLQGAAFVELAADIHNHGLREPIVLFEGMILDGRNRHAACISAGIEPRFTTYDGADPLAYVISLNLHRRHLDESQRAMCAQKAETIQHGGDRVSEQDANLHLERPDRTRVELAEIFNVSPRTIATAKIVLTEGAPELIAAVEQGEASVSAAADVATLPVDEQREIVARGEDEILKAAKEIRTERAKVKQREIIEVAKKKAEAAPVGTYSVIVIDPPWPMEKIERDVRPNQVAFEYPTMDESQLVEFGRLIVRPMVAEDCHMFMWTTQRFLPMAFRLLANYGFAYVLEMVWHKPGGPQPFGLPQYNCEFVLYGRRGSPKFIDTKSFNCCFEATRREHSRKPDEFYDLIRRVTTGRRIDIFSREPREGFAQFGNEVEKFAEAG